MTKYHYQFTTGLTVEAESVEAAEVIINRWLDILATVQALPDRPWALTFEDCDWFEVTNA